MALDSPDDMELDLVKTTRASSLADDSSIHSTNYSTRSMRHVVPSTAALPPVDGGRSAWLFLAGATVIEILVWGLPFSVGVLHSYWVRELFPGTGGENLLATAATLQVSPSLPGPRSALMDPSSRTDWPHVLRVSHLWTPVHPLCASKEAAADLWTRHGCHSYRW
jgi:hypothetical protein